MKYQRLDPEIGPCLFFWTWKYCEIINSAYVMMVKFWKMNLEPDRAGTTHSPPWGVLCQPCLLRAHWEEYLVPPPFIGCFGIPVFQKRKVFSISLEKFSKVLCFLPESHDQVFPPSPHPLFFFSFSFPPSSTPICSSFKIMASGLNVSMTGIPESLT